MSRETVGDEVRSGNLTVEGTVKTPAVNHPDATSGGVSVTSLGRVGIGTDAPSNPLDVVGQVRSQVNSAGYAFGSTTSGGGGFFIEPDDYSASNPTWEMRTFANEPIAFQPGGTERMRIDNAGLITGSGTSLGAWTAYTPTLGGTGWAIGDGTVSGRYCQIGKVVHTAIYIVFGSTSTFGSGGLTVTLPSNRMSGTHYTLNGYLRDSSLAAYYPVIAPTIQAGYVYLVNTASNNGVIDGTPFTFASGDILSLSGTYQAA